MFLKNKHKKTVGVFSTYLLEYTLCTLSKLPELTNVIFKKEFKSSQRFLSD